MKRQKIFYGWIIVAAGCAMMAVALGLVSNAFGLFIVPITQELGFGRQAMSFNQSLFMIGGMVVALLSGPLYRRFPLKVLLRISAVALVISYSLYPLARTLPVFYLLSALCAISLSLVTQVPLAILINNWFHEKRGLAVGIAFMGSGLGGMIFNAVGGILLQKVGWRGTFTVFGVCLAVILLPCVFFLIREKPEDMGLSPLGEGGHFVGPQTLQGPLLFTVARDPMFWILVFCITGMGICTNASTSTMVANMQDSGYSPQTASLICSLFMACLAVSKIVLGYIFDKLGLKRALLLSTLCNAAAMFLMTKASMPVLMVLGVMIASMGSAYGSVSHPIIARGLYGTREYTSIMGILTAANSLGSAIAPTLCGSVYDGTGSYKPVFYGLAIMAFVFTFIIQFCCSSEMKRYEGGTHV